MPEAFVYILKSKKDGRHYIGNSADVSKRLERHCVGDTLSTKHRGDFSIVYFEKFSARAEATAKERYIKDLGVKRFIQKTGVA